MTARRRCAIYTRKSTDEGLDQEFNSLDAQREAGEAFIASQRHEGWEGLADRYDDGGYSGGTMDRPALRRLLADIEAGRVDIVLVYKVDRLSRSLLDFARIMETFEKRGVSFVSVTQQFNTASSMGRLVLNVLLSFAQFEREMISERTRDKLGAARRKGKWVGGTPPLGYDVVEGRLVVNAEEASLVRDVFDLYLRELSLLRVVLILNTRGVHTKSWTTKNGHARRGRPWTRGAVHRLLTNVHYIGKVRYDGHIYDGEHEAIVDADVFARVQRLLQESQHDVAGGARNQHGFLLRGLVRCAACESTMTASFTSSRGRAYRYYRCTSVVARGTNACPVRAVTAAKLEDFVVARIRELAASPELVEPLFARVTAQRDHERASLEQEQARLLHERQDHGREARRLVTALAAAGSSENRLAAEHLRELEARVAAIDVRLSEIAEALGAIDRATIRVGDVERALADFGAIWSELSFRERARFVHLLFSQVTYDGQNGRVHVTFHAAGVARLAAERRSQSEATCPPPC